jgi:membrane protein
MIAQTWMLLKESVNSILEDEALTQGAAIAFYTVTSIGPVLFIVVAIAGLVFGEEAASGAMSAQFGGLMGQQSAELLQTAIQNASGKLSGALATPVGIVALIVTASAVFTKMQQTLNVMWRAKPQDSTLSVLLRSRATNLGPVAALGFLLLVSLVTISAIPTALSKYINAMLPGQVLNRHGSRA